MICLAVALVAGAIAVPHVQIIGIDRPSDAAPPYIGTVTIVNLAFREARIYVEPSGCGLPEIPTIHRVRPFGIARYRAMFLSEADGSVVATSFWSYGKGVKGSPIRAN